MRFLMISEVIEVTWFTKICLISKAKLGNYKHYLHDAGYPPQKKFKGILFKILLMIISTTMID